MTTGLATRLVRNDGTETFELKSPTVEPVLSQSLEVRAILSVAGELSGTTPTLTREVYQISVEVHGMEAADYPNSSAYSDHDYGFENELRRATKTWGPTTADGFDTFEWDGRVLTGVITEYGGRESVEETKGRDYSVDLEFSHLSVFSG